MKMNKTYRMARRVCGDFHGALTCANLFKKCNLQNLQEAKLGLIGICGVDYESFHNSFVPDIGMTREEVNRTSGCFTYLYEDGSSVATLVCDGDTDFNSCSGDTCFGFYLLTDPQNWDTELVKAIEAREQEQVDVALNEWSRLSLDQRVEACQKSSVCIFAARHEHMPDDQDLIELLAG